jgi:hypothetical protein
MDKVTQYQQIICDLLKEYASIKKSLTPNVKAQVIIDKENNHYQLMSIGWHNNRYVYTIAFHFDIINEKIWIQQNNTDILIADELMERGAPKSDIVLGFISEKARSFSGFAMA